MKKLGVLIVILSLVLGIFSCDGGGGSDGDDNPITTVAEQFRGTYKWNSDEFTTKETKYIIGSDQLLRPS